MGESDIKVQLAMAQELSGSARVGRWLHRMGARAAWLAAAAISLGFWEPHVRQIGAAAYIALAVALWHGDRRNIS